MKAFLLTAGLGTRLLPLTAELPKCLVPIYNRPLIDWWIDALQSAGVEEVLINLHHLPEKVTAHFTGMTMPFKIKFFYEETLLGSAGTLRENFDFVKDEKNFFVIYGDNLTNIKLKDLHRFHNNQPHLLTVALFRTGKPQNCGIARLNEQHTIIDFAEKPVNPVSDLANAGIYMVSPKVITAIEPDRIPCDIGFDLLPQYINRMSGWMMRDYLIDIGTHENLERARREWPAIIQKK